MTDGEKLIWATTFSASIAAGCNPPTAIRLATRAVERLREVDITGMQSTEQQAVREMRRDDLRDHHTRARRQDMTERTGKSMRIEITLHNPGGSPSFMIRRYEQARDYSVDGAFFRVVSANGVVSMWPQSQIFEIVVDDGAGAGDGGGGR